MSFEMIAALALQSDDSCGIILEQTSLPPRQTDGAGDEQSRIPKLSLGTEDRRRVRCASSRRTMPVYVNEDIIIKSDK